MIGVQTSRLRNAGRRIKTVKRIGENNYGSKKRNNNGVLHEMIDAFTINFGCSKCSLRKECDECEMRHETYLCDAMGCFCFVNVVK